MEKIYSYSEFVSATKTMSTGDYEQRQEAQRRLMEFRGRDSATYEQCMERMRREFRRHNALK